MNGSQSWSINADQHASDAFYSKKVEGTSNFITEIFFLTVAASTLSILVNAASMNGSQSWSRQVVILNMKPSDDTCEPFMDAAFTKIDRVDADYLHRDSRVDMRDETKTASPVVCGWCS
jgi:hypothetical protein